MAYKALYRKYRPQTFEEVVGQQHIVATLQNAIKINKLAHAYLFCGPRGTGKTSIAKLLAKTINCTSEGHRPCGKCSNCIDIQESVHPDVVEMDAATNNGVDEIRELIEKVKYAPMQGKYKVYIIDEVHMITANAFNALLKTLEEPPEYCIFILATTEPHKILPTIISRCQRFDFNKISKYQIAERINYVLEQEKIECELEAVNLIAEIAEGGMRDALSILDQCVAYCQHKVTVEDVGAVYGVVSTADKIKLFETIRDKDVERLIAMVNEFSRKGIDIQRLTADLINMAKEAVIYSYSAKESLLEKLQPAQAALLVNSFSTSQLLKQIDYLMETSSRYRDATDGFACFEVCLLKMMDYTDDRKPLPENQVPAETKTQGSKLNEIQVKGQIKPVEPAKTAESVKTMDYTDDRNPHTENRDVDETKTEGPKLNNIQVKEEPVIDIKERRNLNDEEYYQILNVSNKAIKEQCLPLWNRFTESLSGEEARLLAGSTLMAASEKNLIIEVSDRQAADYLNEVNCLDKLENKAAEIFNCQRLFSFVTADQRDYLINYFRSRRMQAPKMTNEEKIAEKTTDVEQNMSALFGKNGYTIVEE